MRTGSRVRICQGAGIDSGKVGTVVDRSEVKIDHRCVPTNVAGAYKPVDWQEEVAVRLDGGQLITMFKSYLEAIG